MIACCTGLHLARGAWCPASPVSGVHVPCLRTAPRGPGFDEHNAKALKLVVDGA
jgi:hypothetical protein